MGTSSERPKIAVGLATRGDDIVPSLVHFISCQILVHQARFIWKGCNFSAQIPQEAIYQEAADEGADWLLMVDSDVTPPLDALERMLKHGLDALTAPIWHYNAGTGEIHLNVTKEFGKRETNSDRKGLEKVRSSSFGCLLLSGRVLQEFKQRGERFTYWSPLIEKELEYMSSDVIFFRKLEKMGFQLWVDWDIRGCEHFTKVHLSDRVLGRLVNGGGKE